MKKVTLLTVAALCLTASLASAQINFYTNDCGQGTTQGNTVTNTCLSNSGTAFTSYCSMVMPAVTEVGFVGSIGVIDVMTMAATVDDWWRQDTCRQTGFGLVADNTMGGTCPTLWDVVPGAGANLGSIYGVHGNNWIRFVLGQVLVATNAYDLTGDGVTETSVFKFTVLKSKSVGTGACAGCTDGACLVLNEINLQTLTDTPATFLRLTTPITNNFVNYNSFTGASCPSAVPTRNRTWGAVKSLYR